MRIQPWSGGIPKTMISCIIVLSLVITTSSCTQPGTEDSTYVPSEGSVDSPQNIGSASSGTAVYDGRVALFQDSLYTVAVTSGSYCLLRVEQMTEDVNLYVYGDSVFSTSAGSSEAAGTAPEQVVLLSTGEKLFIRVSLVAGLGAQFTLSVTEAPKVSEAPGPETAVDLGSVATPVTANGAIQFIDYDTGLDADWWQFSIGSTHDVTIETSQTGALFDTEMSLYRVDTTLSEVEYAWDGTGNDIIGFNDDVGTGYYSRIVDTLNAGTYVVRVNYSTLYGTPGEGSYAITVSVP